MLNKDIYIMSLSTISSFIEPHTIEQYRKLKSAHGYFTFLLDSINENKSRDIFSGCSNVLGQLSKEKKDEILSYINEPTNDKWELLYSTLISPTTTLWQAWLAIESQGPRRKKQNGQWTSIPTTAVFIKSIRETINSELLRTKKKTTSLLEQINELEANFPALKTSPLAQKDYLADLDEEEKEQVASKILNFPVKKAI